jgi:DMSO reductase family type II enzyme chaperone
MTTLASTARARSRLFQLMALGFAHPVEEFHQVLQEGGYSHALAAASATAQTGGHFVHSERQNFADFEARYIELFQVGHRGKPIVALNAGDHDETNPGDSRPDFLLEYAGWYRHFGLKTDESADANELPDHLVCQLEFMAWLAHLEHKEDRDESLRQGYRRAQRDFMQRHLQPFLELLVIGLQQDNRPGNNPFFLSLATLALETVDMLAEQFDALTDEADPSGEQDLPDQPATVNLWG